MVFSPNDSPLAGREGTHLTGSKIGDRLKAEAATSVSLRVRCTQNMEWLPRLLLRQTLPRRRLPRSLCAGFHCCECNFYLGVHRCCQRATVARALRCRPVGNCSSAC